MENVLLLTTEDERIIDSYTLISKKSLETKEYAKYLKKYPALEEQEIYILNNLKQEEQEELNSIMARPLMMLYSITNEETAHDLKIKILQEFP